MFKVFSFDHETGRYRRRKACDDFATAVTAAERLAEDEDVLTEIRHDGVTIWDSEANFVVRAADDDDGEGVPVEYTIECGRFPDVGSAVAEAERLCQTKGKYSLVKRGNEMIWNSCDGWLRRPNVGVT